MDPQSAFRKSRMRKILVCGVAAMLIVFAIGYLLVSRSRIHHQLEELEKNMAVQREQSSRLTEELSRQQRADLDIKEDEASQGKEETVSQ